MKKYVIAGLIVLAIDILALYLFLPTGSPKNATPQKAENTAVKIKPANRAELLQYTNQARSEHGLPTLTEDPRLDASAQMKADDESKYNYFGHVSPNDGNHGYQYILQTYPDCPVASENISEGTSFYYPSKQTVNGWMNSPPHRAAILNPNDISVGFGISGQYVVQHFCVNK